MSVNPFKFHQCSIDIYHCVFDTDFPDSHPVCDDFPGTLQNHCIQIWLFGIPQFWFFNRKDYLMCIATLLRLRKHSTGYFSIFLITKRNLYRHFLSNIACPDSNSCIRPSQCSCYKIIVDYIFRSS